MASALGSFLYFLHGIRHYRWLDVRLQTWLTWAALLLGLAGWWLIGRAAGLVMPAFVLLLIISQRWAAAGFYLHFVTTDRQPDPDAAPLWPADKLLVHVSGLFGVEGREGRYTNLLAYYRTFETREHVLMARRTPATFFHIGQWPQEDLGMWYIFAYPEALKSVRRGLIYHGPRPHPGLQVNYVRKNKKNKDINERFYLAFASEPDCSRVQADLLLDLGGPAQTPWRRPGAQP